MPLPSASLLDRITIDPAACHGRPCVRGLRYPVDRLLDLLSGGMTEASFWTIPRTSTPTTSAPSSPTPPP